MPYTVEWGSKYEVGQSHHYSHKDLNCKIARELGWRGSAGTLLAIALLACLRSLPAPPLLLPVHTHAVAFHHR